MKQLQFNFEKDRQLELPFPEGISENQENTERLKKEIASGLLSESDELTTKAELEVSKQRSLFSKG